MHIEIRMTPRLGDCLNIFWGKFFRPPLTMLVYEAKLVKNIEAGKNRAAKACQWTQTCTAWTAADRFVYDFVTLIKPTPTDIQRLAFLARFMNLFWHGTGKPTKPTNTNRESEPTSTYGDYNGSSDSKRRTTESFDKTPTEMGRGGFGGDCGHRRDKHVRAGRHQTFVAHNRGGRPWGARNLGCRHRTRGAGFRTDYQLTDFIAHSRSLQQGG